MVTPHYSLSSATTARFISARVPSQSLLGNLHVFQNRKKNQWRNLEIIILQERQLNSEHRDIASSKESTAIKLKVRGVNTNMSNQKLGSVSLGT